MAYFGDHRGRRASPTVSQCLLESYVQRPRSLLCLGGEALANMDLLDGFNNHQEDNPRAA